MTRTERLELLLATLRERGPLKRKALYASAGLTSALRTVDRDLRDLTRSGEVVSLPKGVYTVRSAVSHSVSQSDKKVSRSDNAVSQFSADRDTPRARQYSSTESVVSRTTENAAAAAALEMVSPGEGDGVAERQESRHETRQSDNDMALVYALGFCERLSERLEDALRRIRELEVEIAHRDLKPENVLAEPRVSANKAQAPEPVASSRPRGPSDAAPTASPSEDEIANAVDPVELAQALEQELLEFDAIARKKGDPLAGEGIRLKKTRELRSDADRRRRALERRRQRLAPAAPKPKAILDETRERMAKLRDECAASAANAPLAGTVDPERFARIARGAAP